MKSHIVAGVLSLVAGTQALAQTSATHALPHVAVLATGGTIAGTAAQAAQTTGYKPGVLTADVLLKSVPSLDDVAQVTGEQVANVGSDNMDNATLLKLAKRVNEVSRATISPVSWSRTVPIPWKKLRTS